MLPETNVFFLLKNDSADTSCSNGTDIDIFLFRGSYNPRFESHSLRAFPDPPMKNYVKITDLPRQPSGSGTRRKIRSRWTSMPELLLYERKEKAGEQGMTGLWQTWVSPWMSDGWMERSFKALQAEMIFTCGGAPPAKRNAWTRFWAAWHCSVDPVISSSLSEQLSSFPWSLMRAQEICRIWLMFWPPDPMTAPTWADVKPSFITACVALLEAPFIITKFLCGGI